MIELLYMAVVREQEVIQSDFLKILDEKPSKQVFLKEVPRLKEPLEELRERIVRAAFHCRYDLSKLEQYPLPEQQDYLYDSLVVEQNTDGTGHNKPKHLSIAPHGAEIKFNGLVWRLFGVCFVRPFKDKKGRRHKRAVHDFLIFFDNGNGTEYKVIKKDTLITAETKRCS